MTSQRQHGAPSEDEVRSLVSRIVGAVLTEEGPGRESESDAPDEPNGLDQPGAGSIAIGADHGGYALKERIAFRLKEEGWDVVDCGTDSHESVDYPDFAHAVAKKVGSEKCSWGIIVDGAGIGSAIVANKVPGVRASLCYDLSSARNAREHNHANVLTLGAGLVGEALAWQIVQEWLATDWGGGRHARRVAKIEALDQQYSR